MIESQLEIGKILLQNASEDEAFLKEINFDEKKNKILEIDIKSIEKDIDLIFKEIDSDSYKKYYYVGNTKGSGSKLYSISTNPNIIPDTIWDLKSKLDKKEDSFLYKKLSIITSVFKYKELKNIFNNKLKESGVNSKSIALYALKIDGRLISEYPEYRELVKNKKTEANSKKGICHLCGKKTFVSSDYTKQLQFKYFITDKISFSQNLKKEKFKDRMGICKNCFLKLLKSEDYITHHLKTSWASTAMLLIPKFIEENTVNTIILNDIAKNILNLADKIYIKKIKETIGTLKDNIEDFESYEENSYVNSYILNILFYKQINNEFKILKLIKDVPPSRFEELNNEINNVGKDLSKYFGNNRKSTFPTMGNISLLFESKKVTFEIYDSLFTGTKIFFPNFIPGILKQCRTLYENKKKNKKGLEWFILTSNSFELLLQYLKLYDKKGANMDNLNDLSEYAKLMNYDEEEMSLFMLGYLIGKIGSKQYNTGSTKSKPILNKINFDGISKDRLIPLTNTIAKYLHQYKLFVNNEKIFAKMKELMDRKLDSWSKKPYENVYYILSGYSYLTNIIINNKKED